MLKGLHLPGQPRYFQQHAKLVFCFILTTCLFILLAILVAQQNTLLMTWNTALYNYLQTFSVIENYKQYITAFSLIGDKRPLFVLLSVIFLWFAFLGHWRTALHWLSNGFICSVCIALSKNLVALPRPEPYDTITHLYAFPSGHTALSIAIYGFLTILIAAQLSTRKYIAYMLLCIIISLIVIARILLAAHWLTDVVGGVLLGTAILSLTVLSYWRYPVPQLSLLPLGLITGATLMLSWLIFGILIT